MMSQTLNLETSIIIIIFLKKDIKTMNFWKENQTVVVYCETHTHTHSTNYPFDTHSKIDCSMVFEKNIHDFYDVSKFFESSQNTQSKTQPLLIFTLINTL